MTRVYQRGRYSFLMLVLSVIIALSSYSGFFRLSSYYYIACILFFFVGYVLPSFKRVEVGSGALLVFLVICVLSIIINNPPRYFRAWERLLAFSLILFALSPIVSNDTITKNRLVLFNSLFLIVIIYSCASFFAYFRGVNFFQRDGVTLDYTHAGHFSGFMNHSMMLAPVASLAAIYCLSMLFRSWKHRKKRVLWLCLTITCAGSVLLSGSRGGTGSLLFAFLIMLFRYNRGRIGKTLSYLLIVSSVLVATTSLWQTIVTPVEEKISGNLERGGLFYSREAKMAARVYEIRNNLLTGVGFATVDETVDFVDKEKGTIEPNSSWLAIFSMTGVFGFLCFVVFYANLLICAYKKINDRILSTLMIGILSFFLLHFITEGYVLAAGSVLCGLFWLSTGVCLGVSREGFSWPHTQE